MVHFTDKQWERLRANYRKWWKNELHRPILPCILQGREPGRLRSEAPLLCFANVNDFSVTAEQLVDRWDYELSCCEFYGDAFPFVPMTQFGPGICAAFLGAELCNDENTVWFRLPKKIPISELHLEYDGENRWLTRVQEIYRAGMRRWGGNVIMGMTDLGGNLDLLAPFVGTEELLIALYDEPEQVKRLIKEIHELWLKFHAQICEILNGSQGYSDWSTIYSEKPSYMLQCDFSYMIGPEMFENFVLNDLESIANRLFRPFYHLDGVGQLSHLNLILSIENVRGIQWVPGEGEVLRRDWSDVFRTISHAGKKLQAYYNLDMHLDEILRVIDRPDDLVKMQFVYPYSDRIKVQKRLAEYGVEEFA